MMPTDMVAWEALAIKSPWISPGKPFTVEQFLALRIAEAATWSNAVERIADYAASAAPAGETWPSFLRNLAITLDGDGKGILDSLPLGRHTGFAHLCERIGLLQHSSEAAGVAFHVRLGERKELFNLLPEEDACTSFGKMLEALRASVPDERVMTWPARAEDVVPFLELAQVMDQATAIGPGMNCSGYCHKAFLRKLLLAIEMLLGQELGKIEYSTVEKFLPDRSNLCTPLHSLRYADMQELFGVSPFLVSCWTCLAKTSAMTNFKIVVGRLHFLIEAYESSVGGPIPSMEMAAKQN